MKSSARMRAYVPIIRRFVGHVMLFHSAVAAQLGLNATDVNCLRLLADEAISAGELSDRLGLTGAATTALIDRLEISGFARRERSKDDRRRVTIHADAEKLQEVDALYGSQGDRMAQLLGKYSAEEFAVIMDFLEQTTVALDAEAQALKKSAKNATSAIFVDN
jgi:DNA-binding MarR family transcriptional regulator